MLTLLSDENAIKIVYDDFDQMHVVQMITGMHPELGFGGGGT